MKLEPSLVSQCLIKDSYYLSKHLSPQAFASLTSSRQQQIQAQLEKSLQKVAARKASWPEITYPDLPVSSQREKILAALAEHQVLVIAGETGSGKTTQLPKILLEAGLGARGLIGHTQPRRLAARSVAQRVAEELNVTLGQEVGYQVRFQDLHSPNSLIKVMTDGVLLAETQHDPYLNRYEAIIIDEAHERSLNIDFLLGYLKRLLPKRPDLKVIITSATLDTQSFARHFNDCPFLEIEGRSYPVTVEYQPLVAEETEREDLTLYQGIEAALHRVEAAEQEFRWRSGPRDVLVFLASEAEIRAAAQEIRKSQNLGNFKACQVIPLYARLPASEQQKVFQQSESFRRIILATNVAETSLTVPGIRYVIDAGTARIRRYSSRAGIERLPIEAISQASANQRSGRCGRLASGLAIRLYSAEDFASRPEFTPPEIKRSNLAAVILQMLALKLGKIEDFPFLEAPEAASVKSGLRLLYELGAVNQRNQLTSLGRNLAKFPLDPRLARMLFAASTNNCLQEMLILVAALSLQDPRERPPEQQQAADQAHAQWADPSSDFASLINLWRAFEEQRQELTANQLRTYCKKNFLSWLRMREWRTTHTQLKMAAKQLNLRINAQPTTYQDLHQALLAGLLSNLGFQQENKEFLGTKGRKFFVHPGSKLAKKPPKWIVAAEVVETSRLFARLVAKIEPEWVESVAPHLIKQHYAEPHWHKKAGQVAAYEKVTLFGLPIVQQRRVDYGKLDPEVSHEIFLRSGLVEGTYISKGAFVAHNQQLLAQLQELEDKARKRDIVVDDELIYAFYASKIPAHINKARDFEAWRKEAEAQNPQLLYLTKAELLARSADEVTQVDFPNQLVWEGIGWPLSYSFAPGQKDDGVNLSVHLAMLPQLPQERLEWLVPGFLEEKIISLMRNLPKQLRKNFVPLPDYAKQALSSLAPSAKPLSQALAEYLAQRARVKIQAADLREQDLADHLRINIKVLDTDGKLLDQGRDLAALQAKFADQAQEVTQALAGQELEVSGATSWSFNDLPAVITRLHAGLTIQAFPAVVDEQTSVGVQIFTNQGLAYQAHNQGLARLIRLELAQKNKYLQTHLPEINQVALMFAKIGTKQDLIEDLINASLQQVFLAAEPSHWPRSAADFRNLIQQQEAHWVPVATELVKQAKQALVVLTPLAAGLKKRATLASALSLQDIERQLKRLFYVGFIQQAGAWLPEYPRYIKAIEVRLEKLERNRHQDLAVAQEVEQLYQRWHERQQVLMLEGKLTADFLEYFWLLEEYRVSVYAQQLGTKQVVSTRRLEQAWNKLLQDSV